MTTTKGARNNESPRVTHRPRVTMKGEMRGLLISRRIVAIFWIVTVVAIFFQMGFTFHNVVRNSRFDLQLSSERIAISQQVGDQSEEGGDFDDENNSRDEIVEPPEDEKFHWDGWFDPVSEYLQSIDFERGAVPEPQVQFLDSIQCKKLKLSTNPPMPRAPTNKACEGYNGILHIEHMDKGGASGTAFFQFVIGMLQWADMHNYKPWIHMNNYTWPIWDEEVHGQGPGVQFTMKGGAFIDDAFNDKDWSHSPFPGEPAVYGELRSHKYKFSGTGVWEHYFEPVSNFVPGDTSCVDKPYLTMSYDNIVPGLHANAPWAPRGWRYGGPEYLMAQNDEVPYSDWYVPFRKYAAKTTKKYIKFNEQIERRAACAHPNPEKSLGMHIRYGDKWTNRELIPTTHFLLYARAFVEQGGKDIYLATDSALVMDIMMRDWPEEVSSHIIQQPGLEALSRDRKAAFDLGVSAHVSNTEALTDILALSKCTFLLHGLSAVSESAMYLNPDLVNRAVNLEGIVFDEGGISVKQWKDKILPQGGLMMN